MDLKHLSSDLENDLARPASQSFFVAAVELDEGTLFLADRAVSLGSDEVVPAVMNVATGGFDVEWQALPEQFQAARWINREIAVLECVSGMGSVYDGAMVFDGIVSAEPEKTNGVLAIRLALPRARVALVPDFGMVDADRYPRASAAASGQTLPLVIGTVEDCPLLGVSIPAATTLSAPALPGDQSLKVADASALASYGAVWLDDESVAYESRSDTELLGCTVLAAHAQGSAVVQAGEAVYLAAGNPCTAIESVTGDGAALSFDQFRTGRVLFARAPLVQTSAEKITDLLQFDQVAAAAFTQTYTITYETGDSVKPVASSDAMTASSSGGSTPAPNAKGRLSVVPQYVTTGVQLQTTGTKYSAIYYHSPALDGTQGSFGSTYADETDYTRYLFTLSCTKVLNIPVGVTATITLKEATSVGDDQIAPVIGTTSSFTVNGQAINGSMSLNVTGTVTFKSTITLLMSAASYTHGAVESIAIGVAAGNQKTLNDLLSGSYGPRAIIDMAYRAAARVTAEWTT